MANSKKIAEASSVEQTLNSQEAFFLKYRKQIITCVTVVIVLIAGWVAYSTFVSGPRENSASTALAKAQEAFIQMDYKTALNGSKNQEGFLQVVDNYGGTDAANLAKLYAGLCYAQMEKWPEAVQYLEDFSTQGDALISPAATAALGNAYANTGEVDKAIKTLQKAADMADSEAEDGVNNAIAPTFRVQAARLLESQGKTEEANAIYVDVKKKYVNSAVAMDIDKYIERTTK